jgi:steroid delta-isomerase-like uncharacterized protein
MSAEHAANKAAVRRLHEATNTGDLGLISDTIDELVEPDAVIRTPVPIDATGARALKEVFTRLLELFPDLQVAIDDLIAEGDKVVSRNTVTGTHRRAYLGRPATGKSVRYSEIFIFRFADGRVAETWGVVDGLSLMQQIGLIARIPGIPQPRTSGAAA